MTPGVLLLLALALVAAPGRRVIGTVKAPDGRAYELGLAACQKNGCPFEVRVIEAGKESARLRLPGVEASAGPIAKEGDRWSIGDGDVYHQVRIDAAVLPLAKGVDGLLIRRSFEGDKQHTQHTIVAPTSSGPAVVLHVAEMHWWFHAVTSADVDGDGEPEIVISRRWLEVFAGPKNEQPDDADVEVRRWNATKGRLEKVAAPLWLAIAGTHPDVLSARTAIEGSKCLSGWLVLETARLPKLAAGKIVIASVAASQASAEALAAGIRRCDAGLGAYVKRGR